MTKPNFVELNRSLLISGFQIFSVTNNTECGKLLEEIKVLLVLRILRACSTHLREALERDLYFPSSAKTIAKEFLYLPRPYSR